MSFRHGSDGGGGASDKPDETEGDFHHERSIHLRLKEMSEDQIEIVRNGIVGSLIGQAGDLGLLNQYRDPKAAIREVAALGRLAYWLDDGEIVVPDRVARDFVVRRAREEVEIDEDLIERYKARLAAHEAWRLFAAEFARGRGDAP